MSVNTPAVPPVDANSGDDASRPEAGAPLSPARSSDRNRASASLVILASLGILFALYVARVVLFPVVLACIITLLLRPIIRRCHRHRIPQALSAALVLCFFLLLFGVTAAYLIVPARDWIQNAPAHMEVVGEKLSAVRDQFEEINEVSEKVREFADGESEKEDDDEDEDEEAGAEEIVGGEDGEEGNEESESTIATAIRGWTGGSDESSEAEDRPVPVEIRQRRPLSGLTLLSTTGDLVGALVVTVVLSFFLLTTGDRLLNHTLQLISSFRDRRNVVAMVHEVEHGISTYLLTVSLINVGLGVVVAGAMWLLGVPNPMLWGAMACVLNFIPYLGAITGSIIVFLVAVYFFDSLAYAFLVPLTYSIITAMEGNLVTPMLLGRQMRLSPVVVFLSLLFWGWMWGVGGALLAVPILAVVKIALERFERTRPVSLLLGV